MFIDRAEIFVKGGQGGHGCVSFRRERFVPKGGPDGGDGGNGGNTYLVADPSISTLLDLTGRHHWIAENGRPGKGKNMTGRRGKDRIVRVPPGTLIYDRDGDRLLKDLDAPDMKVCIARGGKGGKGNQHFASSRNQTPRHATPGGEPDERWLRLELKLIADVGLVGLPNAGKSTLLSRVTRARPKIADYPFTTREPQLGIVELPGYRRFVMADIPGLIEGAHEGVGLGHDFLRHIERTRVIDCEVMAISGGTGAGLESLGKRLWDMIADARAAEQDARTAGPEGDPFSGVTQEPLASRPEPPEGTYDDREL